MKKILFLFVLLTISILGKTQNCYDSENYEKGDAAFEEGKYEETIEAYFMAALRCPEDVSYTTAKIVMVCRALSKQVQSKSIDDLEAMYFFRLAVLFQHTEAKPLFEKTANGYDYNNILYDKIDSLSFGNWELLTKIPNEITKCKNLKSLDLSHNIISDCRILKKLPKLTALNLSRNEILDYRFLKKMKGLTKLDLHYNEISDIRFLEKMTNLTELYLYFNNIWDISPLQKLKKLRKLDLRGNEISEYLTDEQLNDLEQKLPNCEIIF